LHEERGDEVLSGIYSIHYMDRLVAYITLIPIIKLQSEGYCTAGFLLSLWGLNQVGLNLKIPKPYLYAIAYNRYIDTIKKAEKAGKTYK